METMMTATQPLGERKRSSMQFVPAAEIDPGVPSPDHKRLKTVIQNYWVQAPVDQLKIEEIAGHIPLPEYLDISLQYLDPNKEFYLLPPYDPDEDRHLDLYQRLVVNNPSTRCDNFSTTWSPDLARDQQYVQLYRILEDDIYNVVPSWADFLASKHPHGFILGSDGLPDPSKMQIYEAIAYAHAEQLCAPNLTHEDIYHCIMDIMQEKWQVKPRLELAKEFQLHLLDSGYDKSELPWKYLSWRNGDMIPIVRNLEIDRFGRWLFLPRIWSMDKDKKRKELEKFHNEKSDQDCSTRIRYLKLKLKLAEKIGLIVKTAPPELAILKD